MTAWSDDELRRAWAKAAERAAPRPDCPSPERIFDAVRGELGPAGASSLLEHVAGCASCAEDWRLAREVSEALPAAEPALARRPWLGGWAALPAAAAVLLAAAAALLVPRVAPYREAAPLAIHSLLDEARPLQRSACLLRWSAGPAGTRYDVLVGTPDLTPLLSERGLPVSELRVPERALARLPAGARLLWRVEALLPDGARVASPTFVSRIE
jgi:hypothetical protein